MEPMRDRKCSSLCAFSSSFSRFLPLPQLTMVDGSRVATERFRAGIEHVDNGKLAGGVCAAGSVGGLSNLR